MENLDLQEIRGQLDEIDTRLVELFEKRMELCGQVAEFKIGTGKAVYDGQREKQKLAAVAAMAAGCSTVFWRSMARAGIPDLPWWTS